MKWTDSNVKKKHTEIFQMIYNIAKITLFADLELKFSDPANKQSDIKAVELFEEHKVLETYLYPGITCDVPTEIKND